ncbi:MAG TPA: hypothetical protein DCR44_07600 [Acholeplasmatales bacterium]|nr:hypothetical protein [Acholeplasmatales bacterium]
MPDIRRIEARHFMTPTRIAGYDFTCNPYVGCGHGCIYCYAKPFGDQPERPASWGSYVDIKRYPHFDIPKNTGSKSLFFSSATDSYQPLEGDERLTRAILDAIKESALRISILTKSALVVRDLDILKQMQSVEVGFSMSMCDEAASFFEPGASRPTERIAAIKTLKEAGIATHVFVAPILPGISDPLMIIDACAPYVDYMMFDTLNLKNPENKLAVFRHVLARRPDLLPLYKDIFEKGDKTWYHDLRSQIIDHARQRGVTIRYIYDRR